MKLSHTDDTMIPFVVQPVYCPQPFVSVPPVTSNYFNILPEN